MNTVLARNPNNGNAMPGESRSLRVQVVATSAEGTRAALAAARTLTSGLAARVVVLVPHVVPHGEALDRPTVTPEWGGARYARLAEELSLDADVRVCVCRSWREGLESMLTRDAPVVIGGRTRRWLPTREQQLAAALQRDAYDVMFIARESRYIRAWRARFEARAGSLRTTP